MFLLTFYVSKNILAFLPITPDSVLSWLVRASRKVRNNGGAV